MKYEHYVGPKNPIINLETDVPAYPISEREKHPFGYRISEDEAIYLCTTRQMKQHHYGRSRFKGVSEAFSVGV